jgi:hypothetical protein
MVTLLSTEKADAEAKFKVLPCNSHMHSTCIPSSQPEPLRGLVFAQTQKKLLVTEVRKLRAQLAAVAEDGAHSGGDSSFLEGLQSPGGV